MTTARDRELANDRLSALAERDRIRITVASGYERNAMDQTLRPL